MMELQDKRSISVYDTEFRNYKSRQTHNKQTVNKIHKETFNKTANCPLL
jgi:hypothetical protein